MLKIENLSVGFNLNTPTEKLVLKNFNLEVENGDFIVLLGSNGAGKSTLFNAILGTIPYIGKITLDGKEIDSISQHKRANDIGVVYQDPLRGTAPNLRIFDNMLLSTRKKTFFGFKKAFRNQAKEDLLDYGLGLENQLDIYAKSLSGGQRQALTLYMATNYNPKLLLLDEHTAALDPNTQDTVMKITNKIVTTKKITTLMITHNLKTALEYGNRLIILNDGKVVVDLKNEEKKNATERELLAMYSKHFSDNILFSEK
ncbi:MAG: ABC transporter ATP-binding protein [Anaeroplasma sp.]